MWSDSPQEYGLNLVGDNNYCRSFRDEQVWCLTTDPWKRWEYCTVPACVPQTQSAEEIGCIPTDGTAYTGKANTTESGLSCKMWSDSPQEYSLTLVGEHNYCRYALGFGLFCFTADPAKLWERCDVPLCVTQTQFIEEIGCRPTDGTPYTGQANTTVSGQTCQM